MLEQLFGSKTRAQLLRTFLQNPDAAFFVRELTRKLGVQINAVRHELRNLETLGLIETVKIEGGKPAQKKHFRLNPRSVIYPHLRDLFLKSRMLLEKDFAKKIQGLGGISYFAMTGRFVGRSDSPVDVLAVGRVDRRKFADLMRRFELEFGHEINFTVLDEEEMRYRMDVMDRFLYNVLEQPQHVFIDEFFNRVNATA